MEKANQHYVPQFYLRNFSQNGRSIGLYINKTKKTILHASIKEQASKKYIYGEDLTIENFFVDIEGNASSIIQQILNGKGFSKKVNDNIDLMEFVLLLESRTLKIADSSIHSSNFIDDILGKPQTSNIDKIPNLVSILTALESTEILFDLNMAIITITGEDQFITSDTPVCRYNLLYVLRNYATLRGYGLTNVGAQFFLPLSPKHCLYLFDPDTYEIINDISNIKKADVDELNKLFFLNSYQYIFFNQSITMDYIENLTSKENHSNKIQDEKKVFGNMIFNQTNKVTDKINLSFVAVKSERYKMSLPSHLGGPVRPFAQKIMDKIDSKRKKEKL